MGNALSETFECHTIFIQQLSGVKDVVFEDVVFDNNSYYQVGY